jgi:hypothetical protein
MSAWKNPPKSSPINVCQIKCIHACIFPRKKTSKLWSSSCYFQNNCQKKTLPQKAKIRPIWSHCPNRC